MSDRSKAWEAFSDRQNIYREREGLPPFSANLREFAPMMAGFCEGYSAAIFDSTMAVSLALSTENEIAE